MYIADVNVYIYTKLADNAKGEEEAALYQKIARRWLVHSNWWLQLAQRNCLFLICCFNSVLLVVVALIVALLIEKPYWMLPSIIALVLLISVFIIQVFIIHKDQPKVPIVKERKNFKLVRVVDPSLSHNDWVERLIESHKYLNECRDISIV